MNTPEKSHETSLADESAGIEANIGLRPLTLEEQLVLCCHEMARTYTRDEKDYR